VLKETLRRGRGRETLAWGIYFEEEITIMVKNRSAQFSIHALVALGLVLALPGCVGSSEEDKECDATEERLSLEETDDPCAEEVHEQKPQGRPTEGDCKMCQSTCCNDPD
jgi:hypothetical protein